jgi:hypothetical protein
MLVVYPPSTPHTPLVDNSKHFNCNPSFVFLCGIYRTKSMPTNTNEGAPGGQHLVSPSTHITIGEFHVLIKISHG